MIVGHDDIDIVSVADGGPFTLVANGGNSSSTGGSTIAVTLNNVPAGALVVVSTKYEDADNTITMSDGSSTFSSLTRQTNGGSVVQQIFYITSSSASGTVTYTATFAGSYAFRNIHAYVFSYSGICLYDTSSQSATFAANPNSGSVTTSSNKHHVAIGTYGETIGTAPTNELLFGSAAQNRDIFAQVSSIVWSSVYSDGSKTGNCSMTLAVSTHIMSLIVFKTV
jgi:hypothetical protein